MAPLFSELEFRLSIADLGNGVCLLNLGGEIDLDSVERLDGAIELLAELRARSVVVDLTEALLIEATCLERLVALARLTQATGGDVVVVCGDDVASRTLTTEGLDRTLTLARSTAEALLYLRASAHREEATH